MKSLLFILLFLTQFVKADITSNQLDSLQKKYNTSKSDSIKAKILNDAADIIFLQKPDSAIKLWNESSRILELNLKNTTLNVNERKTYLSILSTVLLNKGYYHYKRSERDIALECFNKSVAIREELKDNQALASAKLSIGSILLEAGKVDEALNLNLAIINEFNSVLKKKDLATAYNTIGLIYKTKGDINKALEYYFKSKKIREKIKDFKGIASTLSNISTSFSNQGNIKDALNYAFESLKLDELTNNGFGIANSFNNIGNIYKEQGELDKAIDYFEKSIKKFKQMNDKKGASHAMINIALVYKSKEDYYTSEKYLTEALKIKEQIKDRKGAADAKIQLGAITRLKGIKLKNNQNIIAADSCYKLAIRFQSEALQDKIIFKDKLGIVRSYNALVITMTDLGPNEDSNYKAALDSALKGLAMAEELNFPLEVSNLSISIAKLHALLKNYKEAYKMFEKHIAMHDSVFNDANKKTTQKMQLKYEWEKKEIELTLMQEKMDIEHTQAIQTEQIKFLFKQEQFVLIKKQEEQKLKAEEAIKNQQLKKKFKQEQLEQKQTDRLNDIALLAQKKQRKLFYLFISVGLFLVCAFLLIMINRFKVSKKQNLLIEKQNIEVTQAYKQLNEKTEEVLDSIRYAARIQKNLITPEKYIQNELNRLKRS